MRYEKGNNCVHHMSKSGMISTFFTDSVYGQADKNHKYHFLLYHTYLSSSVLKPLFHISKTPQGKHGAML